MSLYDVYPDNLNVVKAELDKDRKTATLTMKDGSKHVVEVKDDMKKYKSVSVGYNNSVIFSMEEVKRGV